MKYFDMNPIDFESNTQAPFFNMKAMLLFRTRSLEPYQKEMQYQLVLMDNPNCTIYQI